MTTTGYSRSRQFRWRIGYLVIPGVIYLALFYVFPIEETLRLSFGSPAAIDSFVDTSLSISTWIVFKQTIDMAIVVTAITLFIGYPIAYLLVQSSKDVQRILLILVLLPYWISTLVRSYAWMSILARNGVVNWLLVSSGLAVDPLDMLFNRFGAVVGMVNVVLPIMVFVLFAAFSRIDRNLLKIGAILGGRPFFVFGRVWLPLSMTGVASGCILVFLISFGVFTTPAILGGATETSVAMAIEQKVNQLLDIPAAAALSTLLLLITFILLAITRRFWVPALLGTPAAVRSKAARGFFASVFDYIELGMAKLRPSQRSLTAGRSHTRILRLTRRPILQWFFCGVIFLYLLAPVFVVIGLSFSDRSFLQFPPENISLRWFENFFSNEAWISSAGRSFIVASIATAIVAILGFMTAYGIERKAGNRKDWLFVVFLSPLVVPPTILAFGLYYIYAQLGWIGNLPAIAAAHVVLVLPFMVVAICQGIRSLDPHLEVAAGSLGARPLYSFRRITLPLLRTAIVSGSLLAFLTSFDELIIAIYLTGPRSATLPKQMWDSVRFHVDPTTAAAATLLVVLSIVALGASIAVNTGRRQGIREDT